MHFRERRIPSPGHQLARRHDERDAKRQRLEGGRLPLLGPGGIGPEWTWAGAASGGLLPKGEFPGAIGVPMALGKGDQAHYSPDPDHLYLNATVFGQTTFSTQTYNQGTISTAGSPSNTVTGSGTGWTQALLGGVLVAQGHSVAITAVNSATSLTVDPQMTALAGTAYTITYISGGVNPTSSQPATFDTTYDKVLLRKPSDFKMAVVRFSVPISAVPLFYYPIGSCSVGAICGGTVYPRGTTASIPGQQIVVVQSADLADDLPAGTPGYPNGAIAVWTLQQFIDGINDAMYQVAAQMWVDQTMSTLSAGGLNNGWIGSPPGGPSITFSGTPKLPVYSNVAARHNGEFAPHLAFDPATSMLSLAFEQAQWVAAGGSQPVATYTNVWSPSATSSPPAGTASLFFNYNLYQTYLSTFPGNYTQSFQQIANGGPLPAGMDVQVLCEDKSQYLHPVEGTVVALNTNAGSNVLFHNAGAVQTITWTNVNVATGMQVGDVIVLSGITSNLFANGAYVITSAPSADQWLAYNSTTAAHVPDGTTFTNNGTDLPSYIRVPRWMQLPGQVNVLTQECPTVPGWSGLVSLRLVTSSVPVRPEFVPTPSFNPSGPGSTNTSGFFITSTTQNALGQFVTATGNNSNGGTLTSATSQTSTSTVNTQSIMIDFLPDTPNQLALRDVLSYTSREQYRWIDLIGDNEMQRFDVTAQWVDRFGNAFTLTVSPNEVFDCKFLFQHKYS